MKKITLLLTAFFVGFVAQAQITISQSVDPVTVDTGGVACWASGTGEYRDNAFARTYDLENDFGITGAFEISSVEFGQGSGDDGKVINLNIYTVDTEDLASAVFTLVATVDHTLSSADDLTLISEDISATIPAGSIVVFEVFGPDSGAVTFQRFFPGFNLAGENSPSWIKSDGCTIPWTQTDLVAPDQEYVMNLVGEEVLAVGDNLSEVVSVYPNPTSTVLYVKLPSNIDVKSSSVTDMLGRTTGVVYSNGEINVAGLAQGVYFLNLDTNFGTYTQKVVKQ